MSSWEAIGKSDDWYTPAYIFDALDCVFDLDAAAPENCAPNVPCRRWLFRDSLTTTWEGFVWLNPPFGGRNGIKPWLDKFFTHGNGIALTPDRTSAPWWQEAACRSDAHLLTRGKVRFLRPDGSEGKSPGCGTTLFAAGPRAVSALRRAASAGLGFMAVEARAQRLAEAAE